MICAVARNGAGFAMSVMATANSDEELAGAELDAYNAGYKDGYRDGFEAGVDRDYCEDCGDYH